VSFLRIDVEAQAKFVIAAKSGGVRGQEEVARAIAYLQFLEKKIFFGLDFWNVSGSAKGILKSHATLRSGVPTWRLYPTHVFCIPLLVVQAQDLYVTDVCDKAGLSRAESRLAKG
jgi:hypothetical protein